MKNFLKNCFGVYKEISKEVTENHIFAYASQSSFFVVVSAIPFVMIVLYILQMIVTVSPDDIFSLVGEFLPAQVQNLIIRLIDDAYSKVTVSSVSLTSVFLIWSASKGLKAICYGLRITFRTNDNSGYFVITFWSLIYTLFFIVIITALAVVIVFGKSLATLIITYFPDFKDIVNLILNLRYIVFLLVLTLLFMSCYKFLGKSEIKFKKHFLGAFIAALSWLLFSYFYSLFLSNLGRFSYIYGSLAAIIFMMLWMWFCMLFLLFGAELNYYIYSDDIGIVQKIKNIILNK